MDFDKKTIFAFILIGLILILIQTDFYQKRFLPQPAPAPTEVASPDSGARTQAPAEAEPEPSGEPTPVAGTGEVQIRPGPVESGLQELAGRGEDVVVETDLYRAVFSTQGATLRSWMLKDYTGVDGQPVQIVGDDGFGDLAVLIPTDEDTLDTGALVFAVDKRELILRNRVSGTVTFTLDLGSGRRVRKTYTFSRGRYDVSLRLELENLNRMVRGYAYFLSWRTGLRGTEPDFTDDMRNAKAYAYQGDAESFDAGKKFNPGEWDNPTKWVAIRTKYFTVAVIPEDKEGQAVRFRGEEEDIGEKAAWKKYGFDLEMPFEANRERVVDKFTIYFGPLDYDIVKTYGVGLENMMSFGWAIFRPFGKMILWSFNALYKIIPNYGWVIVIFSILIKLLLFPLTRKSYQSMKEMQRLQPLMQEINEKYKDDPQKKQQEIMNLYRAHGVNPLGGCIPMLLQWPLLIALFNVFRTTIQLRGAPFILWIHDLSRPDTIAHLPFSLPLYGDTVNILPLFMGVTMFVQQKMTMKDPKQKAMVYFMPLFFTLLFNRFPSGLNLYYALFNLFSIIQEKVVPYHPPTEEELKARANKSTKAKPRRLKHDYRGRYYKQK